MPQKTNLNISPYYDDFNKDDQFYKILFKPGYPVQARELTGLQSLLQNQVESFGKHIFKEGSMVIPGGIELDNSYFSAKINDTHLGIDVSVYLSSIIAANGGRGLRVRGQTSGIVATIKNFILPPAEGVDNITIFIKYQQSGTDGESTAFPDGEVLVLEEPLTYGNTTLTIGETVLTLTSEDATATGTAFGVNAGVYFLRGSFVDVPSSLIILEPYSVEPSYRVGFDISEEIINSNDDSSLYDNAKGFTNFAAPGADRFKIGVKLSKKALTDYEDTNFVELMRVDAGEIKKLQDNSTYNEIKKYFAKRTYDESGDYSVEPFKVNIQNSLNDEINSQGLFTEDRLTDDGNTPQEGLMCVKLSPGKAYVKGFDVEFSGVEVIDADKPRTTATVDTALIPFEMGSMIKVNNVTGSPLISVGGNNTNVVKLYNRRRGTGTAVSGLEIGEARVYSFNVTDASYTNDTTDFDLHLYDIQTYTILKCTAIATSKPIGTRVRGLASGAKGFLAKVSGSTGVHELAVSQTSGTFIVGEQILFSEQTTAATVSIKEIAAFTVDDIKYIRQDTFSSTGISTFAADTVLYDRILSGFSPADQINVVGTAATAINRNFAGKVGIKTDSVISFTGVDSTDPVYNRVTGISADGKTLSLTTVQTVSGINDGGTLTTSSTTTTPFRIKVPRILNIGSTGLFTELPKENIESVNFANSNLIISKQITGQNVSGNSLTLSSQSGLNASAGITSAFFEPFDAEKYSITYQDGTIEPLTSDQVSITNGGDTITFNGLAHNNKNPVVVGVTLKKLGITSKTKDYLRSQTIEVTRTQGVATPFNGLSSSRAYGLRVEDEEISLNVADAIKLVAVLESKDTNTAILDKLTFVAGLGLDTNTIIGEQIKGVDSRAVGQIVSRTSNTISFVYLNDNIFTVGEVVKFKDSGVETVLQGVSVGNYVDRTDNYQLDNGNREQFVDYSRIVRNSNSGIPSKKLLIIFDKYQVASGNTGDLFTVNSYTKERYSEDIPFIGGFQGQDVLDYRPRVSEFTYSGGGHSPFAFSSRAFESTNPFNITPNESSLLGFNYFLGRIDKVVITKDEAIQIIQGEPSDFPQPPSVNTDAMEIAEITLPPYLYDLRDARIRLKDNRRFTMRDIGELEKRIENLETITSLSALELDTKSLQVKDADGLNRFKSGFVVNDFKDRSFIDFNPEGGSRCDVDVSKKELYCAIDFWSMNPETAFNPSIDVSNADLNSNIQLLDTNCKKTGDFITLDFEEKDWIENPQATTTENVNPFNVIAFHGVVHLDPPSDNWARTIYVNNERVESTGARWVESSNIVSDTTTRGRTRTSVSDVQVNTRGRIWRGSRSWLGRIWTGRRGRTWSWWQGVRRTTTSTTQVTRRVERSFTNTLVGPSEEKDYIESVKTSSAVDPFMRSRNVAFAASGLKPLTRHYHFLDSGIPDIVPKVFEIEMASGTFSVFEDVKVEVNGTQIGLLRSQSPNHKYGDEARPEFTAGLGAPNSKVEKYIIDPFDRTRPAPSETYSATSKLFNVDVIGLANNEKYFGYVVRGAKLTGASSGAVATVSNVTLFSDNWGDVVGAFFFRNANTTPKPPTLFTTGTKTFKVTSTIDGKIPLPSDLPLASSATGTYLGTGTVLTQTNQVVQLRNPPPPPARENEVTVTTRDEVTTSTQNIGRQFTIRRGRRRRRRRRAGKRDPLAQSFTVNETGAFLTSFDVYFASKDETAKLTVQLRTVQLGTPTEMLVQDFAEVVVNPNDINISADASVPTTISFASPIYLPPGEEFALVFLCPASDKYTMWCSTMGEKSIKTTQLPDVQNVVVSKQYLGGSLFKSQNGTIWTPSQNQDLTFKLRKAQFVETGTATFYNTPIEPGNFNTQVLTNNPIRSLPRKLKVTIDGGGTRTNANLPIGRKVSTGAAGDSEDQSVTGIIEGQGAPVTAEGVATGGRGYSLSSTTAVPTVALTGSGSGLTVNVTLSNEVVTGIAINNGGTGYQVGDVFTLDNTSSKVTRGAGFKGTVETINTTFDTLYLTDVQGEKFTNNEPLVTYGAGNDTRAVISNVAVNGDSVVNGDLFAGNVFEVTQYNHAHHGATNKVAIENVKPDTLIVPSTSSLTAESTIVSLANTAPFATFSGIATDRGEALIEEEIVSYVVGSGQLTLTRGVLNTVALPHPEGASVQTYEAAGVSLVGINTTFTVPTNTTLKNAGQFDNYYLEVDRSALDPLNQRTGNSLLCFRDEKAFGAKTVRISQNHQYSSLSPDFNFITPGTETEITASVRTISGTSAGGNEISFVDQGFENISLQQFKFFSSPRLIASTINEDKLTALPKQKSLTMNVNMSTTDPNLSPALDTKNATFNFGRNKVNNPIGFNNYATDSRTNQILNDPHGSIFVSERVDLENPATSLKILVGASVEPGTDFRVFYRLFTGDSSEVESTYRPFPGYANMIDTDGDSFGDEVIDFAKNDGRADAIVAPNVMDQFSEYQFTANDLEQFTSFTIKIVMTSTNEAVFVRLRDFRAIALA